MRALPAAEAAHSMTNRDHTSHSDAEADEQPGDGADSPSEVGSESSSTGDDTEPNGDDAGFSVPSPARMGFDDSEESSTGGEGNDEPVESPTGDTAGDTFEEIPEEAIESASDSEETRSDESGSDESDDSTGTLMGGFQARELDSKDSSGGPDSADSPAEEGGSDDEFLEVDEQEDLIIEEEAAEQPPSVEDGAFVEPRQEDEDSVVVGESDAEYDIGPTVVSDEHLTVDEEELDASSEHSPAASGVLDEIAEEMEAAEQAGGLEEASNVDSGDATVEERHTHQGTGDTLLDAVSDGPGDIALEQEHPTIVDEDFQFEDFEAAAPEDSGGDSGGEGFHGEPSLNIDDEAVADDDFEYEEYEKTAISDQVLDFDESSIPGPPEAELPPEAGGVSPAPSPSEEGLPGRPGDAGMRESTSDPAGSAESGGFDSQQTNLFDGSASAQREPPRFEVVSGPSNGDVFELHDRRVVGGRSTDNDIVVPDEAMSREHFAVVREVDDSHTIRDLDSVNGTILNGRLIEEADLLSGDRFETGNTTFEFVVPGASRQQRERDRETLSPAPEAAVAHRPRRGTRTGEGEDDELTRWLNRVIVVAVALMVPLAAAFVYVLASIADRPSEAQLRKTARARGSFLAGVDAQRDRDWETAAAKLKAARERDPDLPGLESRLEQVETERRAASKLEEARQALEAGRREEALKLAGSIPAESSYHPEARQLIRSERRRKRIARLEDEAREKLEAGSPNGALDAVRDLLEVAPTHPAALALRSRSLEETDLEAEDGDDSNRTGDGEESDGEETVGKSEDETEENSPEASSQWPTTAGRDDDSGGGGGTDSSWLLDSDDDSNESGGGGTAPTGDIDFQRGFALYDQERFDEAIAHFERAARTSSGSVADRASRIAGNISKFQQSYRAAKSSMQSGAWDRAARQFRRAMSADEAVAGATYFESDINSNIARAKAKRGMEQLENGSHGKAYSSYESARQYDSSHSDVRSLLRSLKKKADSLYVQASAKRKTNPRRAAALCRTIMSMVPEDSDPYRNARKLLDEI